MGPTWENQRIASSKVTSTAKPCSLLHCRILEMDQSGIVSRLLTVTTLNQLTIQPSGIFYILCRFMMVLLIAFVFLFHSLKKTKKNKNKTKQKKTNLDIPLARTLESTFPKPKGVTGSIWIYVAAGESSVCILYLLSPKDIQ